MAIKTGRACDLGEQLKGLLQDPLALWHAHRDGTGTDFMVDAEAMQAMTTYQLHDRRLDDSDHQQMLIALGWHHDRGNLLHFLANPRIEPTNYRAERALRATDIARKVSRDLQKDRGAHTFAVFMSVVRTLAKHNGELLVENLYHLFRTSSLQMLHPDTSGGSKPLINEVCGNINIKPYPVFYDRV